MVRRWHIEHADGRPWTGEEMDAHINAQRAQCHMEDVEEPCEDYCVNGFGMIYLVDTDGEVWTLVSDDAVVVWE